jgi:hypothetical protein
VWWLVSNIAAVALVAAGWSPPARLDPAAVDPDRALFSEPTGHPRRHHPAPDPSPSRAPRPAPTPPPPAPLGLEERQVAAAEANANALTQLALLEASRAQPAPMVAVRPPWPQWKRALVVFIALSTPGTLLVLAGAGHTIRNEPPPETTPATTTTVDGLQFDPADLEPQP